MKRLHIALVAHDHFKPDMAEFVSFNYDTLVGHQLISTGTTGRVVEEAIKAQMKADSKVRPLDLKKLNSGPLGGDQQLGALIVEGKVDYLFFFWDPMQPQPHDVDVKALLRLAVLYNIPTASNRATADFIISSTLFASDYEPKKRDYSSHLLRKV